jgi:hypothetical protein
MIQQSDDSSDSASLSKLAGVFSPWFGDCAEFVVFEGGFGKRGLLLAKIAGKRRTSTCGGG